MHLKKYEWVGSPDLGDCSLWVRTATLDFDDGSWQCQVTASDFTAQDALASEPARLVVRGKYTYNDKLTSQVVQSIKRDNALAFFQTIHTYINLWRAKKFKSKFSIKLDEDNCTFQSHYYAKKRFKHHIIIISYIYIRSFAQTNPLLYIPHICVYIIHKL